MPSTKQERNGPAIIAKPNEFEAQHRKAVLEHLPPLSAKEPAFADRPKLLDRGAWTQAAPLKEQRHFRHVSDSIANNYSPSARHLTSATIYETTRFAPQAEECLTGLLSRSDIATIKTDLLASQQRFEKNRLLMTGLANQQERLESRQRSKNPLTLSLDDGSLSQPITVDDPNGLTQREAAKQVGLLPFLSSRGSSRQRTESGYQTRMDNQMPQQETPPQTLKNTSTCPDVGHRELVSSRRECQSTLDHVLEEERRDVEPSENDHTSEELAVLYF
ncbi:uncharacterized protein [Watersipora subatra]|uniref:uncharacterized protein n=1 Tax=Watersipora subatra TaxID=2589382 RepID=UPI00355C1A7F